jgi:uncharacterized damage-inducible protein DinB
VEDFTDERAMLTSFLDFHRKLARHRVACLSDDEAKTRMVSSLTTPAGIISHLASVERFWFVRVLDGQPWAPPWSKDDPDAAWRVDDLPVADVLADYKSAISESNEIIASHELDARAHAGARVDEHVTLRWIPIHMIAETSQHNGHLDILCEQIANGDPIPVDSHRRGSIPPRGV